MHATVKMPTIRSQKRIGAKERICVPLLKLKWNQRFVPFLRRCIELPLPLFFFPSIYPSCNFVSPRINVVTQAAAAVSHEPPKKIPGPHGRYAGALFTAASKSGMLDKVETELLSITNVMSKVKEKKYFPFSSHPTSYLWSSIHIIICRTKDFRPSCVIRQCQEQKSKSNWAIY